MQSEELRTLALAAGQMGTWTWNAVSGLLTWDEGQYRIFGVDPDDFAVTIGNVRALVHPEDWDHLREAWWQVNEHRQSLRTEFRVLRPSGELRWCIGTAAAGVVSSKVVRVSGVTIDITDRKGAEERQALLAREVDHRARNALAVVQSIVRLTRASSIDGYVAAVEDRIGALARAHVLLSRSRWKGADFGKLVEEAIAPYWAAGHDRIVVAGPKVVLEPATAQSLALALYELATNAAKYGPLSVPAGWVRLTWEIQSGNLVLDWLEIGGPPVEVPLTKGYGTKFISASIERQLDGAVTFDWGREGLHCTLSVPLDDKLKPAERANGGQPTPLCEQAVAVPQILVGNRLLLVEDEALVAMALKDMLTELGFEVVGAFNKVTEALSVVTNQDVNAAVLDVNLGGELIYPVADSLVAKGVPFVFITGYGAEAIDGRFASYRVLQKPIQRQMLQNTFIVGSRGPSRRPLDAV